MRRRLVMRFLVLLLALLALAVACSPDTPPPPVIALHQVLGGDVDPGFRRAERPRGFDFPRDHGPHDGFRNEWWHFIGNVETGRGVRYGFQATFFRTALAPQATPRRHSRWATNQVWMAHAALTDPHHGRHFTDERFAREAMRLAGAAAEPFSLWVGDWRVSGLSGGLGQAGQAGGLGQAGQAGGFPWRLEVASDDFALDLELAPLTPPMLNGERGLSQKSDEPGSASYYYSVSRLDTHGTLRVGDAVHSVSGLSWLDREWSSSALAPEQTGWDWFALQLDDGADLMFYRLRDRHGNTDPHSAGSILDSGRQQTGLRAEDIAFTPKRWWRSQSGARYPLAWELEIKPLGKRWVVEAVLDDQEMALSVTYWEGMVVVREDGEAIGTGYLEMTGYD